MVIVVPAVPQGQKRDDQIVSAVVRRRETARTVTVAEGVGRPDDMIHANRTDHAPPNDELNAARPGTGVQVSPDFTNQVQQKRVTEVDEIEVFLE